MLSRSPARLGCTPSLHGTASTQHRMFALHPPSANQVPTFAYQRTLPRLPVPPLRSTLDRYLKSLVPLLEEAQENGGPDAGEEMKKREKMAKEFEEDVGKKAQERLIDVDRASPNNWLDDNYWIKKAYHEWRAPLLINSNWWLLFHTDTSVPQHITTSTPPDGECSEWQIRRGAWLTRRFLEFKEKLEREEIQPDSSRSGPFDMYQYTRLFNLSRIPQRGCDALSRKPKPQDGRHVLVMLKDWCYAVDVYEKDGTPVPAGEIERRLGEVVRDVQEREKKGEVVDAVGILSADERDAWAANREYLLILSPSTNRRTLTRIEDSLFSLSLDAHTLLPLPTSNPFSSPSIDAHVRNCASGPLGLNRWYDKALTVIVESNARSGMLGEHSPCDALIPSIMVDYAIAMPVDVVGMQKEREVIVSEEGEGWERLEWVLDGRMREEIEAAKGRAKAIVEDSEPSQLWFSEYGTQWIKKTANQPPDAYIQMALQLAYYKSQGEFSATYETASTRVFLHGRTEVIRSYSADSRRWVKAMVDPSSSVQTRHSLLSKAIASHNAYTRDASVGKGCDRHLMGLKLMLRDGESSALFEDPLFAKSAEWKLSTSGLSEGMRFHGTGFGTVWPDGYGINYLAAPNLVKFGIESKKSCPETSTEQLKEKIVESLREMRQVCEESASLTSKL